MKKLFLMVFLSCFILCLIPAITSARASAKPDKEQYAYPEKEKTGEMATEEKGAKELDLGEPTKKEISEEDRESEWREGVENDNPTFDEDSNEPEEGSTQWDQDF